MEEYKFNIGDRVVVIGGNYNEQYNPIWGQNDEYIIGSVTGIASDKKNCSVRWDGKSTQTYGTDYLLHLIAWADRPKPKVQELELEHFDKVILDTTVKNEIIAVLKQSVNYEKLFTEWGLGEVIEYGKGMTFLFYGGAGTGKTWMATCMAKALKREILVISAAEIQSMEPGGANRNIQNAFNEAKKKKKLLFLDECDSLITSRNDVGMILGSEINTLLTEIERFEGVCVLATNRIANMDEALERRISLIIEFPEPDEPARELIWSKLLPSKMPLNKDVNAKILASYKLTGGLIKNCVLQAARFAIAEGAEAVGLNHFDAAIQRLLKSKSLMGTASRYRQTIMADFGRGIGKTKVNDITNF